MICASGPEGAIRSIFAGTSTTRPAESVQTRTAGAASTGRFGAQETAAHPQKIAKATPVTAFCLQKFALVLTGDFLKDSLIIVLFCKIMRLSREAPIKPSIYVLMRRQAAGIASFFNC
jgi:hypothetical protein